jgi:ribosomal protein S12 methylthiotransferase accessory factor
MESQSDLFGRAAGALEAAPGSATPSPDVAGLLGLLGYGDGDSFAAPQRAALLRAAARLPRLFRLAVPDAPGLCFFGAEVDPATVGATGRGLPIASSAGSGLDWGTAFECCIGEAIEYLAGIWPPNLGGRIATPQDGMRSLDPASSAFVAAVLAYCGVPASRPIAWMPAVRLRDGMQGHFPLDLCVRRPVEERDFTPPLRLGTGCAAGRSVAAATLHALLELVERDASALWWRGGARGRLLPAENAAVCHSAALIGRLRGDAPGRKTWLLDITTDIAIPVIAAVSARPDGLGFTYGLACRPNYVAAAAAAVFELCQMELGYRLAAGRRQERGDAALNEGDRGHLHRADLIDVGSCALLHPISPGGPAWVGPPANGDEPTLQHLVAWLASQEIDAYAVDLTQPELGIPVVRVMAPALQLDPCAIATERLAQMIASTGGGDAYSGGVVLF